MTKQWEKCWQAKLSSSWTNGVDLTDYTWRFGRSRCFWCSNNFQLRFVNAVTPRRLGEVRRFLPRTLLLLSFYRLIVEDLLVLIAHTIHHRGYLAESEPPIVNEYWQGIWGDSMRDTRSDGTVGFHWSAAVALLDLIEQVLVWRVALTSERDYCGIWILVVALAKRDAVRLTKILNAVHSRATIIAPVCALVATFRFFFLPLVALYLYTYTVALLLPPTLRLYSPLINSDSLILLEIRRVIYSCIGFLIWLHSAFITQFCSTILHHELQHL